jgi:hypothetical protein
MKYKDQERSTGLPLDQAMIKQLVLEAEIRGMRIGELLTAHSRDQKERPVSADG